LTPVDFAAIFFASLRCSSSNYSSSSRRRASRCSKLAANPRSLKPFGALDVFIGPSKENLDAVARALARFGAPGDIVDTLRGLGPDEFLFLGASPVRIDILRRVDGLVFGDAYARRVTVQWDGVPVSIIAFDDLVASKKAAGRERDRRDVELLEAARRSKQGA